jgi:hypothetical protein
MPLKFRHEVIDPDPPGSRHDITLIADINGDGKNDIVIGGNQGPVNLFWYENPSWRRHDMAAAEDLEAGGAVADIAGSGRPDIVAGQQLSKELYWFECPPDPTGPWTKRLIEDRFLQYHDQIFGDVDGDGQEELVFVSQRSGIIAYYDIPADPRAEPWPRDCFHLIAENLEQRTEGLAIVDIDGDGRNEIIAGTYIFRRPEERGGPWRAQRYVQELAMRHTRVAVADLRGDGRLHIILAEGESSPARLAVCAPPDWKAVVLKDDLFHPHSLAAADFNGDGLPDVFIAEMGLGENPDPKMFIFLNRGGGEFGEVLIHSGTPTHEAKVGDLTGDGRPDIVGKPYMPEKHIDVWFNDS